MGATHTRGPWRTAGGDAILAGRDDNLTVVASAELEANACLIAAAPELLDTDAGLAEAAEDYARLIQVEQFDRNDIAVHRAYERLRTAITASRAAIAKATGQ